MRMDENELLKKDIVEKTLEVNEDVADRNQDGLTGWRKTQGNWVVETDGQDRGRWRHLLEEVKDHPGLYSR